MICNALTSSVLKSCDKSMGGVSKIYIADHENITAITETANEVTAITAAAAPFYEFEFNRNTSSYKEDLAIDLTTGSSFFTQTVSLILNKRETAKRTAIEQLTDGQKKLMIIVLDATGTYWLFGKNEGAYTTAITGGSGVAKSDRNGYEITLTAEELEQAIQVESTIIAALIA